MRGWSLVTVLFPVKFVLLRRSLCKRNSKVKEFSRRDGLNLKQVRQRCNAGTGLSQRSSQAPGPPRVPLLGLPSAPPRSLLHPCQAPFCHFVPRVGPSFLAQ